MPIQTLKKTNIFFPDGAKVSIKEKGAGSFTDLGAIQSAVISTLNYEENQVETANAGQLDKQIRNMTIAGGFTLINLEPDAVERLGGNIFNKDITTSSPTTGVDDQVLLNGFWVDKGINNIILIESTVKLKAFVVPTFTSVIGSVDGALVEDDDFSIIPDPNSFSGFSIVLNLAGTILTTIAQDITINFDSVTPVATTVLSVGTSTLILDAYAMRITHTDDNNKIRQLDLFSVDPNSGGFQFNFKGANEDGVEEMPVTYTAKLDSSLVDGKQLMSWTIETGAQ